MLEAHPAAAATADAGGKLPLALALANGASDDAAMVLVAAAPDAVGSDGRMPLHLVIAAKRPEELWKRVLELRAAAATADAGGKYAFELLLPSSASDDAATLLITACIAASGEGVLWRGCSGTRPSAKKPSAEAVRAAVGGSRRGGAAVRDAGGLEAGRRRARAAAAWAGREEGLASRRAGDGQDGV